MTLLRLSSKHSTGKSLAIIIMGRVLQCLTNSNMPIYNVSRRCFPAKKYISIINTGNHMRMFTPITAIKIKFYCVVLCIFRVFDCSIREYKLYWGYS